MKKSFRKYINSGFTVVVAASLAVLPINSATAYETDGLMFYYDFSNMSATTSGTTLADLSGNNRIGTLRGTGLVYDSSERALQFPGGSNGTAYVELSGQFRDFSQGVTIEFEGHFGSTLSDWERIFDFGVPGGLEDDFWIGHMYDTGELALETWINNTNQGRCFTSTNGTALNSTGTFSKWVITVDSTNGCRIYKDGVELPTQIRDANYNPAYDTPVQANGSAYPLPAISDRTANFLGRSNWSADADLEGSIRYLRLYNTALTSDEVLNNAVNSSTPTVDPVSQPTNETTTLAQTGVETSVWLFTGFALIFSGIVLARKRKKA